MDNSFLSQEEIDALLNPKNDDEPKEEIIENKELSQEDIDAMLNAQAEEPKEEPINENKELSQEDIDAMLNAQTADPKEEIKVDDPSKPMGIQVEEGLLNEFEEDALGEIGNIAAGSASTALSDLLSHKVMINTPKVFVVKPENLISNLEVPYILLEVNYISGLEGTNLLVLKRSDVAIISDIMMGGAGDNPDLELDEIRISAISEAMNQMVGSSATAMSEIFNKKVNISPPKVTSVDVNMEDFKYNWSSDKEVVVTAFNIQIDNLLDSEIFQVMPLDVAKQEVALLVEVTTGQTASEPENKPETKTESNTVSQTKTQAEPQQKQDVKEVKISAPQFETINTSNPNINQKNLDLILDVPLKISVILGRTKRPINEILALNPGSIVELEKYANEPVDILVNGTLIAQGEVVVVNENYGVKITNILSAENRIKNLGRLN
ncbi:flagellar motor switch protein FliN/FliY [Desulfonispora thiosulfatigenes DSM 11270]|uniref:Flagellar motor switch protein FliN/FliY n=1 Tax=Desulfonispora thiosulfatigenes DSM 11270 TaxID=656914 RepID=A0A1W1UM62_DESTI|nr:flagellar motor switch phosphatase FliY [Desulfonispora thiosulfatigenes]SMB82225.1 flagellar motor switch protein FliN/FliY [Desulfonispora thiosulfatigenes DSM 11270]